MTVVKMSDSPCTDDGEAIAGSVDVFDGEGSVGQAHLCALRVALVMRGGARDGAGAFEMDGDVSLRDGGDCERG